MMTGVKPVIMVAVSIKRKDNVLKRISTDGASRLWLGTSS